MKANPFMTLLTIVLFLATLQTKAQTNEIIKVKANIAELLKNEVSISRRNYDDTKTKSYSSWGTPENILILADRIEFKNKPGNTILYYSDLPDHNIQFCSSGKLEGAQFEENSIIYSPVKGVGKQLFDDLNSLKKLLSGKPL